MPKIALPNKGRLNEDIRVLLRDAGLDVRSHDERALVASLGEDFSAIFVRAQDIPEFVADGAADAGITGYDCVLESERELDTLLDLGLGRCRLAVAMPARDEARGLDGLPDDARIATCFPALTRKYFASRAKPVRVVVVSGAAEVTPELGIADAIVDLVATGSTLKVNGLVEVATIVESTARLVTKPRARVEDGVARALDELAMALASVLAGRGQRYVMANVPRAALDAVRALLPGLNGPTVVDVLGGAFVAVHAVVPRAMVYRTTLGLKALGCEGILVTRIERLIP